MLILDFSVVLGTFNINLLMKIFSNKFKSDKKTYTSQILTYSCLVYLMPLNFTFMFLYYTETVSLTFTLLLYYRLLCADNH